MPILTDLAAAQVRRGVKTLYGKTLSRPSLLVSDGVSAIYACDVEIGPVDPTGLISQYNEQKKHGQIKVNRDGTTVPGDLSGLPGQEGWTLDDVLRVNTILHNVTIARANADLLYADVGSPVTLTRSASGQWQVTGFSQEMPGTYNLVPVDLSTMEIGSVLDMSLDTRLLTWGEMGTLEGFGSLPLGASGIFSGGGVLIRIV